MKVDYSGMAENLKSDLKKAIEQNKRTEEQANKTSELKSCPFCGGEAMLTNQLAADQYGHKLWNVICVKCGNRTMSYWDKNHVIEKWNNRKPLERVIERLETEGKLADEERDRCARENPLHFDTAKGYATGIYNAIEIIKEEMM